MKRLFLLFILLFSLFACQQEETLNPPVNIRYQEETIIWDSVDGATSYSVMLNDVPYFVTDPLFDLHNSPNGYYTVRVCAIKNDLHSIYSDEVLFTVARMYDYPTNISIDEGVMLWQKVDDADSYVVLINNVEYPIAITRMELSFLDENQTYMISVKAVFELGESNYSSSIEYFTYFNVLTSYKGVYNINISYNLLIYLGTIYTIEHVFYKGANLENSHFVLCEEGLSIDYELLEGFELGSHIIELYTPYGIVELLIEITENTKPVMISSNSAHYVFGNDIEFLFELFDYTFIGLNGHDISEEDYNFENNTLTIYAEYLDPKIADFESDTIIFTYQLKLGDSITLGYIFVRIP